MKILDSTEIVDLDTIRATDRILWEDTDRDEVLLFLETPIEYKKYFSVDQNALLLGFLFPAWNFAERRIYVDNAVFDLICAREESY